MAAILWADVEALQSNLSTVSAAAQMIFLAHVNEDTIRQLLTPAALLVVEREAQGVVMLAQVADCSLEAHTIECCGRTQPDRLVPVVGVLDGLLEEPRLNRRKRPRRERSVSRSGRYICAP